MIVLRVRRVRMARFVQVFAFYARKTGTLYLNLSAGKDAKIIQLI